MLALSGYYGLLPRAQWKERWADITAPVDDAKLLSQGITGELEISLGDYVSLGGSSHLRLTDNEWALEGDSAFQALPELLHQNYAVYAALESPHVEAEVSMTTRDIRLWNTETLAARRVAQGGFQMILKGSAYWKGYVLNRAAYTKGGLAGQWIPGAYKAPLYRPEYQYWQWNYQGPGVPGHYRLDADLSARVRSIIVLMRYENVLDGFGQAGYFETIPYPMPARRFMVGFRVVFTN
jgi:hypothetical protein